MGLCFNKGKWPQVIHASATLMQGSLVALMLRHGALE
jgi:hypothetical protein